MSHETCASSECRDFFPFVAVAQTEKCIKLKLESNICINIAYLFSFYARPIVVSLDLVTTKREVWDRRFCINAYTHAQPHTGLHTATPHPSRSPCEPPTSTFSLWALPRRAQIGANGSSHSALVCRMRPCATAHAIRFNFSSASARPNDGSKAGARKQLST